MTKKSKDKRAFVAALFGATDTGKSYRTQELLKQENPSRLLVWDFKGEYPSDKQFTSTAKLLLYIKSKGKRSRFYISFKPSFDDKVRKLQFDVVCRAVLKHENMMFVVEELAFVTSPNWSPVGWSMLTMTGREQNIKIIGTSQRPARVDKDFFSNVTLLHTRRLSFKADQVTLADALGIRSRELAMLSGHDYVERNMSTGKIIHKKIK